MRTISLLDTSIFVEILNVPYMASQHKAVMEMLRDKIRAREAMFLPMATVFETGNHIGQIADGNHRRQRARNFVTQVELAISGKSPFTPINFLEAQELKLWLTEFPDWVKQKRGFGDLSIKHDWHRLCDQNQARRVYIWSLDQHLSSFDTGDR